MKNNIKAFIKWSRNKIQMRQDPSLVSFPVAKAATLIRRYKTHVMSVKKSKTPHPSFLDDYVDMAPLTSESFTMYTETAHTFIVNQIVVNDTAEALKNILQTIKMVVWIGLP